MNRKHDWQRAFGQADPGFVYNVHATLSHIHAHEEEQAMKKLRVSPILIFTLCLLLAATAIAAGAKYGLMDFLKRYVSIQDTLPQVEQQIERDVTQDGGETPHATFRVREAIYDGHTAYLALEVKPANPDILFFGLDTTMTDPLSLWQGAAFDGSTGTIGAYALAGGKQPVNVAVRSTQEEGDALTLSGFDYLIEEDGTYVLMAEGSTREVFASLPVTLVCITTPVSVDNPEEPAYRMDERATTTLSFTLTALPTGATATGSQVALYADCGVQIERLTLREAALGIAVELEFTVVDEEAYHATDGGLWFEFIDVHGERLPAGMGESAIEQIGENRYLQTDSLAPGEIPASLMVRGYNCWEKNRYEAHEIPVQ